MANVIKIDDHPITKNKKPKIDAPPSSEYDWRKELLHSLLKGAMGPALFTIMSTMIFLMLQSSYPHMALVENIPLWTILSWMAIIFVILYLPIFLYLIVIDKIRVKDNELDKVFRKSDHFEYVDGVRITLDYIMKVKVPSDMTSNLTDIFELKSLIKKGELTKYKLATIKSRLEAKLLYYSLKKAFEGEFIEKIRIFPNNEFH